MKNKTIIFDFDGTIADTLLFNYQKAQEIVGKFKLTNLDNQAIINEIRSKPLQELIKKFKISWLKLPFILLEGRRAQKELNNHLEQIKVFPGMKNSLKKLKKNYQLGILSLNLKENIDKFLALNKLDIFDFIYCESNIFAKNKALNNLMKKYNLSKNSIIYVGDEVWDIEACKKAGIKMIAVGWGLHNKKLLLKNNPDYFVEKPEEIMQILVGEERVELS